MADEILDKVRCPTCNTLFTKKQNLDRHMNDMSRRVCCPVKGCYKDFGRKSDVGQHYRKDHADEESECGEIQEIRVEPRLCHADWTPAARKLLARAPGGGTETPSSVSRFKTDSSQRRKTHVSVDVDGDVDGPSDQPKTSKQPLVNLLKAGKTPRKDGGTGTSKTKASVKERYSVSESEGCGKGATKHTSPEANGLEKTCSDDQVFHCDSESDEDSDGSQAPNLREMVGPPETGTEGGRARGLRAEKVRASAAEGRAPKDGDDKGGPEKDSYSPERKVRRDSTPEDLRRRLGEHEKQVQKRLLELAERHEGNLLERRAPRLIERQRRQEAIEAAAKAVESAEAAEKARVAWLAAVEDVDKHDAEELDLPGQIRAELNRRISLD